MTVHDAAALPRSPLIEARGVGYSAGRRAILEHVDIAVGADEMVTLIGPNGAGKTTLIRLLLGLSQPTQGRIVRQPGLRIGYMPQRFQPSNLLPITARRFLATARAAGGEDLPARLAEVGAAHIAETQLHDLSGGELQRVLLARALLGEPQLLVLDEPVRGVDLTGQSALIDLIADLRRKRGCGMLIVSHELHLVMAATDRVVCLNKHVCCEGRPDSVSADPSFVALFGPGAARRIAVYSHVHDHEHDMTGAIVPEHDHADGRAHGRAHRHDHRHAHDHRHDHARGDSRHQAER